MTLYAPIRFIKPIETAADKTKLTRSGLGLGLGTLCGLLANNTAISQYPHFPMFSPASVDGAYRPVVWAADLAFSAFFALCAAARFSLPSLMAATRAAERASGR
jgi:hypothetical protein